MTEIEQVAIQKARENLLFLCLIYDKNYVINWHHREIAKALEKVESGEIKRLIIEMPPRHGKSALASIFFPAWYLGRNPTKEIITASYNQELARDFGAKTRDIVNDPQYQAVFPLQLKSDTQSKDKWKTNQGGSYTSVGVGGSLTGRGANVLLIDDPFKNREEAESETMRTKIIDWFTSTAYTRLEKDGAVIIIMTRWHTHDLVGQLIEAESKNGEKWERISFPAIAIQDEPKRKSGDPLWPEKYDLQRLEQIKSTIGIYDFSSLYQQTPISSETQEFKKEWFNYHTDEELKGKQLDVYITVDLAISKSDHADSSCLMVVGKEKSNPDWYILEYIHGKLDPLQVIEALFALKAKYQQQLVKVGIETVAYQKAIIYFLDEEMRRRQNYLPIHELKTTVLQKEQRIRGLIPMYRVGVVKHKNTMSELENELLVFPLGAHDDIIDALAYIPELLQPTISKVRINQSYTPISQYGG